MRLQLEHVGNRVSKIKDWKTISFCGLNHFRGNICFKWIPRPHIEVWIFSPFLCGGGGGCMDQRKTDINKSFEVFRLKPTLCGKAEGEGCPEHCHRCHSFWHWWESDSFFFLQDVGYLSSEFCLQLIWAEITKKGTWKAVSWEEECEILALGTRCISWQFLIET